MSLAAAIGHIQSGRMDLAAAILQDHVRQQPHDWQALRLLGKMLCMAGDATAGLGLLRSALDLSGGDGEILCEIGTVLLGNQDWAEAEACFSQALARQPAMTAAAFNLGWVRRQLGRDDEALAAYEQVVAAEPGHAMAWFNLGNIRRDLGDDEGARMAYDRALAAQPDNADILAAQAFIHQRRQCGDQAVLLCRRALAAVPGHAGAGTLLGNLLTSAGRLDEAVALYGEVLRHHPDDRSARLNLGLALRVHGRLTLARETLAALCATAPDMAEAWNALGAVWLDLDELHQAEPAFRRAVELLPDFADAHNNLGKLLASRGDVPGALEHFRQALALQPGNAAVHSNLLFLMLHADGVSPRQLFEEHLAYGRRQEALIPFVPVPVDTVPHRLRIGYVSPDFREHAVMLFFEPVVEHHDRQRFEIFCYSLGADMDAVTARIAAHVEHWRPVAGMAPDRLAEMIRADRIDILVDLAGHTANNGLPVFARRAAPVQATWLGYPATTGLTRMDFRLTDIGGDHGANALSYSERLEYLVIGSAFRPPSDVSIQPVPPVLRYGAPTFGAFNKPLKASDELIAVWCRLLHELPQSRLVMILAGGDAEETRAPLLARFARHGIGSERLVVHGRMPLRDFLAAVADVDVALDTYPYSGGTTSILTLWMGLPLVCRRGGDAASTTGANMMVGMGYPDDVALDDDGYVRLARNWAEQPERLRRFRTEARRRLLDLPVSPFDEGMVVRDLERVYGKWLAQALAAENAMRHWREGGVVPLDPAEDAEADTVTLLLRPCPVGVARPIMAVRGGLPAIHGPARIAASPLYFDSPSLCLEPGAALAVAAETFAPLGGGDFCAEIWVWVEADWIAGIEASPPMLMGQYIHASLPGNGWMVTVRAGGRVHAWLTPTGRVRGEAVRVEVGPTEEALCPGSWNHVALVRRGRNLSLRVNGRSASVLLPPGFHVHASPQPFSVGANATLAAHLAPAVTFIGEVRLSVGTGRYGDDDGVPQRPFSAYPA